MSQAALKERSKPTGEQHARSRRLSRLGRFRIRTMDLYVTRHFLGAYGVCLVSFVGLFILVDAFAKLDRFMGSGTSLIVTLGKYFVAMVPLVYVNYLGPILTLAAAMFTLTTLNRRNELTPLKSSGVSVYRVMLPIFVLAFAFTGLTFYLKDQVLPNHKDALRAALAVGRSGPLSPPPYYDSENKLLFRVQEYLTTSKIAQGVEISELHPNRTVRMQIDASRMEWIPTGHSDPDGGRWVLRSGSIQRWDSMGELVINTTASRFNRLKETFREREIKTNLQPIDLEASDLEISYLSWRDLKKQYQRQPYHRHLAVKLHQHFAFPFSHIVLLFLGIPFVLNVRPSSGFLSLAVSFAICALFFFVSSVCMNVANGESAYLSPILAAWLPVMLFGALGMTMFDKLPT